MPEPPVIALPAVDPARLAAAVESLVGSDAAGSPRLPSSARLDAGARQTLADETRDAAVARTFQALLEVGYLVASADGLADAERDALARLLASVTGQAVDQATLVQHFADLEAGAAVLGRRERLHRAAATFEDAAARAEAAAFAALVAMADGTLAQPEMAALVELGEGLEMSSTEVRAVIDGIASRLMGALR